MCSVGPYSVACMVAYQIVQDTACKDGAWFHNDHQFCLLLVGPSVAEYNPACLCVVWTPAVAGSCIHQQADRPAHRLQPPSVQ